MSGDLGNFLSVFQSFQSLKDVFFLNRTVMMSIISLLNEPNTFSPANVDASVMYRRYIDSKGADKEYENIIK